MDWGAWRAQLIWQTRRVSSEKLQTQETTRLCGYTNSIIASMPKAPIESKTPKKSDRSATNNATKGTPAGNKQRTLLSFFTPKPDSFTPKSAIREEGSTPKVVRSTPVPSSDPIGPSSPADGEETPTTKYRGRKGSTYNCEE